MKRLIAATDGSSVGNPGPSGWAWVASDGSQDWASARRSTNNRMELVAALELLCTYPDRPVLIQSDSQYVVNNFTKWLPVWRQRGMRTDKRRPIENVDLVEKIASRLEETDVRWEWVRGHAGHAPNERADSLARYAATRSKTLSQTGRLPRSANDPPRLPRS